MKARINGCRKYQKNEETQEIEDIIIYYPESYLNNLNSLEYKPLNKNDIICEFVIKDKIGEGAFGSVRLGINKQTNEKVAIKILERSKLKKIEDLIRFEREIEILKKLKHPNIVQLYCVIETERQIYLIMEYLKGIELFQYIILKKRLSEEEACIYFQQIISGIEYLHKLKIAHRDIKPENMIVDQNSKNIKILDFGLSNIYGEKPNEILSTSCGSPCYAAPEMISGKMYKGGGVDIWSVGVVLFSMICGFLPFHEDSNKKMYKKITEGKYTVPSFVSNLGRELIHKILNTNPKKRISIAQIKKDSWIKFYSSGLNELGQSLLNEGLFIDKYVIPIDEEIINKMETLFKIPKIKSRTEVLLNNSNDYTSLYYLLINKKINNGGTSISDFKSDLFVSYINDARNLLSNYDNNLENVVNERKIGYLFELKNSNFKKERHLLNTESNVKSQDNLYNIYFKNITENKIHNLSTNNSSNNIVSKLITKPNNLFMKQKNSINLIPLKKLKNKIKTNLDIENNKESYSDRNNLDKMSAKTTKNSKNLILKTILVKDNENKIITQNYLDTNSIKNNYKINIEQKNETLSTPPINEKIKVFLLSNKNNKIEKISINRINKKNIKDKNNSENFNNINDEIGEEKYLKSIVVEDKNQEIKINLNNRDFNNNDEKYNLNNNIIKNENSHNKKISLTNELNRKHYINYKDSISPIIEPQKTINNTIESNKYNSYKTLDSFTLLTINQKEVSRNNNKKLQELASFNTFSEKEETYKKNNYRKKGLFLCKTNQKLTKKRKTSKLFKNIKSNKKSEIRKNNKNLPNNAIKNIIKKITIDNDNNYLYNKNKYNNTIKNSETTDFTKKISKENYSGKKNNKNKINNKTITNFEYTFNNNRYSFSPIIRRDNDYKLEINRKYKEKINKIINNIKIENSNSIKTNTISSRKYKSVENDKNTNTGNKREKRINCYKSINNKNKNSYLKRFNTANNNLKNNFFHNNYKSNLNSFKNKRKIIQDNKFYYNNTESQKKNQKDFLGIFQNNNTIINKNLFVSDFQISNNINNKSKNNIKSSINKYPDISDFEPFDLNCIFLLSNRIIKKNLKNILEAKKYKVKQINSNKYIFSYEDNKNIYEFSLSKNISGIIKFRRIKGKINNYINDIRYIISKFINL